MCAAFCKGISADLTSEADQERLIETIRKEQGKLHVLVNNSGEATADDGGRVTWCQIQELCIDSGEGSAKIATHDAHQAGTSVTYLPRLLDGW
jgi:NAD(P)-dependent dehydrogenase (short-subunit alcohol dehydrogenase family)